MLYSEELLEHYRHPQNFGALKNPTHTVTLNNPLCGDVITLDIDVKNGKVIKVGFEGKGCAISTASASLFTEYIKNKELANLRNITKKSTMEVVGFEVSPGRVRCLLLPFEALKKIIKEEES